MLIHQVAVTMAMFGTTTKVFRPTTCKSSRVPHNLIIHITITIIAIVIVTIISINLTGVDPLAHFAPLSPLYSHPSPDQQALCSLLSPSRSMLTVSANSETDITLLDALDPKLERPQVSSRSPSRFIRDKFTNNKRKNGGGLGCSVFYGLDLGPKNECTSTDNAPPGTLETYMHEVELEQEHNTPHQPKDGETIDPRSPSPVGMPYICDDDSARRNKSPRLQYDQQSIATMSPQTKTRSFVAALASGMRSCVADVAIKDSTDTSFKDNDMENRTVSDS